MLFFSFSWSFQLSFTFCCCFLLSVFFFCCCCCCCWMLMVSDACATAVVVVVVVGSFSPFPSPSFFFLFSLQKAKRPSEHNNKKKKRTSFSRALTNKGCGYDSSKREEKKKSAFFFNWKLYPRVIYSRSFFFFFFPQFNNWDTGRPVYKFICYKKMSALFPLFFYSSRYSLPDLRIPQKHSRQKKKRTEARPQ